MKNVFLSAIAILTVAALISSCTKTETVYQQYPVPGTYNFENVDYAEATAAVNMWSGLTNYLGKSTSRELSQDTVNNLWNNTNSPFTAETVEGLPNTFASLNAMKGVSLSGKTADPTLMKAYIDSMVKVSKFFNAIASKGVAGKVGIRLVNYSGLEFNQLVAKGLMGAFVMNQLSSHLDKTTKDDNNTVTAGKGTAMQHDWDLAFGYVSLPKSYDSSISYASTVVDRPIALGVYFRERGQYIKAGPTVYNAFLKGRAAINTKDYATRDQAIATIKEYLEKTLAAAAFAYADIPQGSSDRATQFHALSEGIGFVTALKYRPSNSRLTAANYDNLVSIFKTNFYDLVSDASFAKLKQAQAILTTAYGQLK